MTPSHPFLGPDAPESSVRADRNEAQQRELLYGLLGDLPDRQRPVSARLIETTERDGYVLEKLELDLNGIEAVPAYLAKPKNLTGPVPAVLFNHSHGGGYDVGKTEFIEGRSYLQNPPYAKVITDLGMAGLCIDTWVFGERAHTSEADMFKAMLWQGSVLWGMMVFDSIKALDYLESRAEVDPARIATLGISMGSTMAWWHAALDTRLKVCVDICCLTEFQTLLREQGLKRHGVYYYVPSLLKHFTTADINALIAPRAHLALAGTQDGLTPVAGLDLIDAELKRVYAEKNAADKWQLLRYDVGHQETPEGRQEILRFLQAQL
ncbi:MAG: acetylxylan esterase [Candidatus Hydrogenedentes bacterium]|nr:acetylxylan esterase [Candidatus Hydrogenedentota bacterium]